MNERVKEQCISYVVKAMRSIAYSVTVGGYHGQDGIYVSGSDQNGKCIYFTHFESDDIHNILKAHQEGKLVEYLKTMK